MRLVQNDPSSAWCWMMAASWSHPAMAHRLSGQRLILFLATTFNLTLPVAINTTICHLPDFPFLGCCLVTIALVLGHDILKGTPQRLDRRELVADRDDGLEVPVQLVDVCQDLLEALCAGAGRAALA